MNFFPPAGKVIDIGCGQGQDSRFFADHAYEVIGIDFSEEGVKIAKEKSKSHGIDFRVLDISENFPFADNAFDVVYSHLSLHYFDKSKTQSIFDELSRILKTGGVLAILVNSTN